MQLTNEQLLQLIGQKEIEIYALRMQLQQVQQRVQELTDEITQYKTENGESD